MTAPLVSVVMGVYNGAGTLRESVESVLRQDVDLELVVVDDGSTDGTASLLQELASGDRRVRALRQENAGLTSALIRGCAEATGRYLARQDADDLSLTGRLRRQIELLDSDPALTLVSCWSRVIGPAGEILEEKTRPHAMARATEYIDNVATGPLGHGSALFRTADYHRVGGYRSSFYYSQDVDLWLRLTDGGGRIAFVSDFLYEFRLGHGSISLKHVDAQNEIVALAYAAREARRAGLPDTPQTEAAARIRPGGDVVRSRRRRDENYFVGRCLLSRKDRRAVPYLWRSVQGQPLDLRAWAALALAAAVCRRPSEDRP